MPWVQVRMPLPLNYQSWGWRRDNFASFSKAVTLINSMLKKGKKHTGIVEELNKIGLWTARGNPWTEKSLEGYVRRGKVSYKRGPYKNNLRRKASVKNEKNVENEKNVDSLSSPLSCLKLQMKSFPNILQAAAPQLPKAAYSVERKAYRGSPDLSAMRYPLNANNAASPVSGNGLIALKPLTGSEKYHAAKLEAEEEWRGVLRQYPLQMPEGILEAADLKEISKIRLGEDEPYRILRWAGQPLFWVIWNNPYLMGLAWDRASIFSETQPGLLAFEDDFNNIRWVGAAGHDYWLRDLFKFFTAAKNRGLPLNIMEQRMKEEFLRCGTKNGVVALSVTQYVHLSVVEHEFNHGVYRLDKGYRFAARALWRSLDEREHRLVLDFPLMFNYHTRNEWLVIKEWLAYFRDLSQVLFRIRLAGYWGDGDGITVEIVRLVKDINRRVIRLEDKSAFYKQLPGKRLDNVWGISGDSEETQEELELAQEGESRGER